MPSEEQLQQLTISPVAEDERVREEFEATWGIIVSEIVQDPKFSDIRSSINWLEEVLQRNVPFGTQTRAFLHINMYRSLVPNRTEQDDFLNYVCGWMLEILHESINMSNDMITNSPMRRGQPCWYRHQNVGMSALNDAFLLENVAYFLAFKYLKGKDYLLNFLELMYDCSIKNSVGEISLASEKGAWNRFTDETYKNLVKYKTSYYTFYAPVITAMERAGIKDKAILDGIEEVTLATGELFHIQEDYLDCYADTMLTGRIGTHIKDGKITWLILNAFKRASESQRKILEVNYGKSDDTAAEFKVKRVYDELGLAEIYQTEEDERYADILGKIRALPAAIPQEPLLNVLEKIYKRKK